MLYFTHQAKRMENLKEIFFLKLCKTTIFILNKYKLKSKFTYAFFLFSLKEILPYSVENYTYIFIMKEKLLLYTIFLI